MATASAPKTRQELEALIASPSTSFTDKIFYRDLLNSASQPGQTPESFAAYARENYLNSLNQTEARLNIYEELLAQQKATAPYGVNWVSGIGLEDTAMEMAAQLSRSGVKSIADVTQGTATVDGQTVTVPINKRTGEPLKAEYAFADASSGGRTWSGTFAGRGSTRFNVEFVNGVPVFTAQQQPTVKSGVEKLASKALPLALGVALGPAGYGLSAAAAGAIAGGAGGLLQSGELKDALKGAALGAVGGYAKEALLGADAATAASDLAKIEASMGTPGLLGSAEILDAINQAGISAPTAAVTPALDYSAISPDVAAGNVAALEQSIVNGQLADLQAKLANTPETITEMRRSGFGRMRAVSVPNPEYTNIQNQIAALQQPALSTTIPVTPAVVETPAGLLSPEVQIQAPSILTEPVLVPGDNRLVSTLAESPAVVEDITGNLSAQTQAATRAFNPASFNPATASAEDLIRYNEAMGQALGRAQQGLVDSGQVLDTLAPTGTQNLSNRLQVGDSEYAGGDRTREALYGDKGYGEISDKTITQAPITTSPITSLGPAATLDDVIKYITGGGFLGGVTDALKSGLSKAFGGQDVKGTGGPNLSAIALGALLNRQQPSAPSLSVIPGKAVDITSPIQSLLAPKLVQQRPVSLL